MSKKFLYLFLALALPGLVFVFLKKFGKNEFSVPIFFEEGIVRDSICHITVDGPYHVADSVLTRLNLNNSNVKLVIIHPFIKEDLTEINRVRDKYKMERVDILIISGVVDKPQTTIKKVFLNEIEFGSIVGCRLKVKEPWSVVLLDGENSIRGFYDGSRRDEVDRLDMELSILLKKY